MRSLAIIFILLIPWMTFAQYGYVTGKVYDRFGPLSDVRITIEDSPFATFTDENGYFAFEIDTGTYQLNIDLTGYNLVERSFRLTNLEQRALEIEMENTLMDANVALGSKSRESQNQLESPVPIDLILAEDLINTGETELAPALHQLLPSFYSSKQSADDGINMVDPVSLRGLGPDQLLVLVNGKRMHKSAFLNVSDVFGKGTAGPDLNIIPLAAIQKIEILRDGASSQYGSDAIAGVINIILKDRVAITSISPYVGTTTQDGELTRSISINKGFGIG
jgi:iron complex outermembrane receptor protein